MGSCSATARDAAAEDVALPLVFDPGARPAASRRGTAEEEVAAPEEVAVDGKAVRETTSVLSSFALLVRGRVTAEEDAVVVDGTIPFLGARTMEGRSVEDGFSGCERRLFFTLPGRYTVTEAVDAVSGEGGGEGGEASSCAAAFAGGGGGGGLPGAIPRCIPTGVLRLAPLGSAPVPSALARSRRTPTVVFFSSLSFFSRLSMPLMGVEDAAAVRRRRVLWL